MPVRLNSIVRFLNTELKIRSIQDQSRNGLQVRASSAVSKVGLATDASRDTFKMAKSMHCDLLIVHHGILWKGQKDTAGLVKKRKDFLKKAHISLYAAHLPLDKSKKYGHNTYLFKVVGAIPRESFGGVGYLGYLGKMESIGTIAKR